MRSLADKAVSVLAAGLDSPIDWVRFGAAKTVLERTLPKDQEPREPADTGWMDYLTDAQLATLSRWIDEARERVPISEPPDDGDVIDVPARVLPPPRPPVRPEPFTVETLPAPGSAQPTKEEQDDDAFEFDVDDAE